MRNLKKNMHSQNDKTRSLLVKIKINIKQEIKNKVKFMQVFK